MPIFIIFVNISAYNGNVIIREKKCRKYNRTSMQDSHLSEFY